MENHEKNLAHTNESADQSDKNQDNPNAAGLNNWNDRLDENLESEEDGDLSADENAKKYSEEKGSGDQSDATEA